MERGSILYEGKSKRVFETSDPSKVILEFKDDATAFNGVKHAQFEGKGALNSQITEKLFGYLGERGVRTLPALPAHPRSLLGE